MSIVERLRVWPDSLADAKQTMVVAAARIEALEAALREIDRFEVHKKDVAGAIMQRIARAALDKDA